MKEYRTILPDDIKRESTIAFTVLSEGTHLPTEAPMKKGDVPQKFS